MNSDIVKRLRAFRPTYGWPQEQATFVQQTLGEEAADRIEALEAEVERLRAVLETAGDAICDVFEQMRRGNWQDDHGHFVMNNTAMLQLKEALAAMIAVRAAARDGGE